MPTKNTAAVVENVAGAINVLNVFVTHVDPIRFPIATNFPSAIFAERYREKKIYSFASLPMPLPLLLVVMLILLLISLLLLLLNGGKFARALTRNVDNHNADIKVKVFLCTAKINTQKLNTAERAHSTRTPKF